MKNTLNEASTTLVKDAEEVKRLNEELIKTTKSLTLATKEVSELVCSFFLAIIPEVNLMTAVYPSSKLFEHLDHLNRDSK